MGAPQQVEEFFVVVMRHAEPDYNGTALVPEADIYIQEIASQLFVLKAYIQQISNKGCEFVVAHKSKDAPPFLTARTLAHCLGKLPLANWSTMPIDVVILAQTLAKFTSQRILVLVGHEPDMGGLLRQLGLQCEGLEYAMPVCVRLRMKNGGIAAAAYLSF
jgi:hypothetical protein